jgi:uncharacterized protein YbjT (DUF2867 family)
MGSILVTKATGTTGRYVVRGLAERGVAVKAGSRSPAVAAEGDIVPVRFDWDDRSTWASAVDGTDAIYLVKPESDEVTEIIRDFVHLVEDSGATRIVLLSEIAAETRAGDAHELQVEQIIEQSNLDYAILRPNWFMQDFIDERFFGNLIRREGVIVMTTGGSAMSWIDARDIAAVAVELLIGQNCGKQALTLTGPGAFTLEQLADRISAAAGAVVLPLEEATEAAETRMRNAGAPEQFIEYFSNIGRSIMKGDTAVVTDVVAQITGQQPRSLDAFLAEHAPSLQRVGE